MMMRAQEQSGVDWWLIIPVGILIALGVATMMSFGTTDGFALKQLIFTLVGMIVSFGISFLDITTLQKSQWFAPILYLVGIILLIGLFVFGSTFNGATSWYSLGPISLQPVDLVKVVLIIVLAKYLSRRHIEIARMKHLIITGIYFIIPFFLVLMQPDFGSAVILIAIWAGMLLVSGLTRKHVVLFVALAGIIGGLVWGFVFQPYQKARIVSFLNPQSDILGAGYNSYQSKIAVGSGQLLGKGIGYGTQSRLQFLPEHETDFIFASFAEEWGLVGSVLVLILFAILLLRMLRVARYASTNFARLIVIGCVWYVGTHMVLNIGMNLGLLPVTGITLPFMSYGGSHLLVEWIMIGMVMSVERYGTRQSLPEDIRYEFQGFGSE